MEIKYTTLLFLRKGDQILLAMKKRGFGVGKYNGVGGKFMPNETPHEAMIRECQEEILVTPTKYCRVALIRFNELFDNNQKQKIIMHVFLADEWAGEPTESEEMSPKWFKISDIPYNKMFADDIFWLPLILEEKYILADFDFNKDWTLASSNIIEIKKEDLAEDLFKGIVVVESLANREILDKMLVVDIKRSVSLNRTLWTGYLRKEFIYSLASNLNDQFYTYFWKGKNIIVVFQNKIFEFNYADRVKLEQTIAYGETLKIPKEQLDFTID
ncbi:MAG: 8-oxo-dGTP diphosphatase [Deltaproteobacteria bacterium]|jgi:ADP-ribose pyrophosphatase YjhB (NUDIX family)|nr:8-oxo-dGTP diphosphatase [Deltaproteobacteria bacterium]